jgi:PIN domain nuclease of toxin-antitoxin system
VPSAEAPSAAFLLDASAVLAHLNDEDGASAAGEAMAAGAAISVANWAEVLSKAAEVGEDPGQLAEELRDLLQVEPISDADCIEIARLRPLTRARGLSLADRACLALAKRLGLPVVTADRDWAEVDLGVTVRLIR